MSAPINITGAAVPGGYPPAGLPFALVYQGYAGRMPATALLPRGVWIVEMMGQVDPEGEGANFPPPVPAGYVPAGLPFNIAIPLGKREVRWSDAGYATEPGDSLRPNLSYRPRLISGPRWRRSMSIEPENPGAGVEHGALELADMDGAVSSALSGIAWEGHPVRILRGPARVGAQADRGDFGLVAEAATERLLRNSERLRVVLRGLDKLLDRPLQQERYAGTGGIEGTSEFEGQTKPVAIGRVSNAPVTWIDPANEVFQWHWREVAGIDRLVDFGAEITLDTGVGTGGDVADYSALIGASITPGQFITCNALGVGRVGFTLPGADIRVWGRGDAGGPDGYVETHFDLLDLLARSYGAWDRDIEGADALPGGVCGFYWGAGASDVPLFDALLSVVRSCAAQVWVTRNGALRTARLSLPEDGVPAMEFTVDNMLSWPEELPAPPLRWRQAVGYRPLVQAFQVGDLDDTIAAGDIPEYTEPYLQVSAYSNVTIRRRYPEALEREPFVTAFQNASDAEGVRDYIGALLGTPLRIWRFEVGLEALSLQINDPVRIRHPRIDASAAGRKATVLEIENDGDRITVTVLVRAGG